MDISNQNPILYARLIEDTVKGVVSHYRPADLVADYQARRLADTGQERQPRRYYLLSVKLAGLPTLRVKLPKWATVHTMYL